MADTVDVATRSRMMAAVSSKNTGPEMALRRLLWAAGARGYRLHRRDIEGKPDVAWVGRRVAVFVDGAFWHGHPSAFTPGKSGDYWDSKIQRNRQRDDEVNQMLLDGGWTVVRVWDFEVQDRPDDVLALVFDALAQSDRVESRGHSVATLQSNGGPAVDA